MADQDESGCADQPDEDIDERLMSDEPEVRSEGYAMAFVRYLDRLYAYLRARYWYCLSRDDTADLCGSTFAGLMKKVEDGRYKAGARSSRCCLESPEISSSN